MPRPLLDTTVTLPPRLPSPHVVREALRLAFEEYQWFKPKRYGLDTRNPPPEGPVEYDHLLETLYSLGSVIIIGRTEDYCLYFSVARSHEPRYIGKFSWVLPANRAPKASWLEEHQRQVAHLMQLFDSPLAYSALFSDIGSKQHRLVEQAVGQTREFTVRDYSEGLAGLYWRNFYGEPFVRLFGERLSALPAESVTRLVGGQVLVQPYALPIQAGSEEAREQERRLIHLLGPECFYDFEHHQKPIRLPELPQPS